MKDREGQRGVSRKGTAVLQVSKTFWIWRSLSRSTTEFFDEFGVAQVTRIVTFSNFYSFAYKLNR